MTRYLIINDLKKMIKILLYVYPCALILAIITRLLMLGEQNTIKFVVQNIFASLTYSAVATILVNTFVQILREFVCSFYRDESYLTHTLPVTKTQLIVAKYVSALTVVLSSVLVSLLSLGIVFYGMGIVELMQQSLQLGVVDFDMSMSAFFTVVSILIFLQICAIISFAFTAVIKANTYHGKKVIKGLLWFALFYFGAMIVSLLVALVVFALAGNFGELFAQNITQNTLIGVFAVVIVLYAIYAITFFFISNKLFSKGVNVD